MIMHNMIIKDEWDEKDHGSLEYDQDGSKVLSEQEYWKPNPLVLYEFLKIQHMRCCETN
jgi:hypothetical protein